MASQEQQDTLNDYLERINSRLLRGDNEYYDPETKTYLVGTFYVHEGLDYWELREVTSESGEHRVIGNTEFGSFDSLVAFLEGFLAGHYETCDTLDVDIEEEEIDLDTFDFNDPNLDPDEKEALLAMKARLDEDRAKAKDGEATAN